MVMLPSFNHVALTCQDMVKTERFYTDYFGFQRARVIPLGETQIVFLKAGTIYLELFKAEEPAPVSAPTADGVHYAGLRHIAFKVDNVDAILAEMGSAAKITLGPLDFDAFIPGWRTVWLADPDGNIVEVSQGFADQENPPALT